MALTLAQLKEIADWVYNQPTPTNSYTSQNPMRKYYITVSGEDSKIYKKDEGIVAIFSNRILPYTDNDEVASMTAKIPMNAQTPSGNTVGVNWMGVGATIDVKTLIRNAGIFLGVKISKDIDKVNPVVYNEMVNICRDFADNTNRIPYYYCKDTHDGIKYLSFIPLDILVDLAIYLNGLGLFLQNKQLFEPGYFPTITTNYFNNTTLRDYLPSLSDWYNVQDKDSFFRNFKTYYDFDDSWDVVITGFMTAFDNQIDYSDCIKLGYSYSSTQKVLTAKVIPMSCIFSGQTSYGNYRPATFTNAIEYSQVTNVKEDWYLNTYTIEYNTTTGEFTQSSNLVDYDKYDVSSTNSFGGYSNLNFNKLYKTYRKQYRYQSYRDALLVDGFSSLSDNTGYDSDVLKFTKLKFLHMYDEILYKVVKNTVTDITDKDFIFLCGGTNDSNQSTYILKIFKNVTSMSSSALHTLSEGLPFGLYRGILRVAEKSYSVSDWTYDRIIRNYTGNYRSSYTNLRGSTFNFGRQTLIQTYEILQSDYTITQLDDVITDQYVFVSPYINNTTHYFQCSNLGEVIEFGEQENYAGFELDSSANYPTGVVDKSSFLAIYNNRIHPSLGNPLVMGGEIIPNQASYTEWIECSVSETPPATQDDSEIWTLDDTTDKDREKISDDIEKGADDDDSDDEDDEGEGLPTPKDDVGDMDEIDPDDVLNLTQNKFVTQWVLSKDNLDVFGTAINNRGFITSIRDLFADPLDAVISLQVFPIECVPTYSVVAEDMTIRGTKVKYSYRTQDDISTVEHTVVAQAIKLLTCYKHLDLGEIDFTPNSDFDYMTYQDVDGVTTTLYLPFVGNIDLDMRVLYGHKLYLEAFAESYTGQLIYHLWLDKGTDHCRLLTSLTGNFAINIPIKFDGYTSLMNSFTRG